MRTDALTAVGIRGTAISIAESPRTPENSAEVQNYPFTRATFAQLGGKLRATSIPSKTELSRAPLFRTQLAIISTPLSREIFSVLPNTPSALE
jgi:hypothetical protein